MTKEELDEIRRIWAAATPGPWRAISVVQGYDWQFIPKVAAYVANCSKEDANAIASAPTHIAKLIAEVHRLRWFEEHSDEYVERMAGEWGKCVVCGAHVPIDDNGLALPIVHLPSCNYAAHKRPA